MDPGTKETLTEVILERLSEDIIDGVLPPGHNLRIEQLKEQYDVGASPLREALSRLTSLGLVTNETRRGFRVAPLSEADLLDLTRMRILVESEALRDAISSGKADWEMEIAGTFARLALAVGRSYESPNDARKTIELAHKQFHMALLAACRSQRLKQLQSTFYDQANRYRHVILSHAQQLDGFIERHEALMETVLKRDPEESIALLSEHLAITPHDVYGVRYEG
ncbi:GntR family transcriptional regulator [Burkholderia pseudomultivorans]|uniref:D-xylose utilization operon transcriptional repressor n=1 Tax=Burkholderia pseudomultivorans TaxID=1207504 RepID=A0ABU2DX98_9BURK|nr:FCD domain-containing protein [Burkholderia pseudomultivorans]MDR8726371.1 putative D-xylose utilization operon transcriptional repressor [Burkholderia pseudomultivorans]MDR8733595.1 putative D-xylose utilization operon transcriptional repressor [Burkholderia pseudomultivorans]MDR8740121.1 putative D-xylose utilization operon transcriptional repressor [Burkholderia pseudomultivorans]MDR8752211.1 putative D-xylose utilization operon transcriptional repressor [Burkholderia pseudomultivorans]M